MGEIHRLITVSDLNLYRSSVTSVPSGIPSLYLHSIYIPFRSGTFTHHISSSEACDLPIRKQ